jgi:hypothetical protein
MGWSAVRNGELLALAASNIAVVVLRARTNRLADLRSRVPALLTAILQVQRGQVVWVGPQPS